MMSENMVKEDNTEMKPEVKVQTVFPQVDILELKDDFMVRADLPGLEIEDISVSLDRDMLTVEAQSDVEGLYPRAFARKFRVMRGIDAEKIRADYKDGVLTLMLAKPVESKPQRIQIQSG
ncbi:MAG: Hsp20/alpha crystallin family protein [Bradymonadales bacterium]|jgi:HSP20 family protein